MVRERRHKDPRISNEDPAQVSARKRYRHLFSLRPFCAFIPRSQISQICSEMLLLFLPANAWILRSNILRFGGTESVTFPEVRVDRVMFRLIDMFPVQVLSDQFMPLQSSNGIVADMSPRSESFFQKVV
jgi:hypothetical protein